MSRLLELIDDLKQDLSIEAGETKHLELRNVLETTIQRLDGIYDQAVKSGGQGYSRAHQRKLLVVAEGGQ